MDEKWIIILVTALQLCQDVRLNINVKIYYLIRHLEITKFASYVLWNIVSLWYFLIIIVHIFIILPCFILTLTLLLFSARRHRSLISISSALKLIWTLLLRSLWHTLIFIFSLKFCIVRKVNILFRNNSHVNALNINFSRHLLWNFVSKQSGLRIRINYNLMESERSLP